MASNQGKRSTDVEHRSLPTERRRERTGAKEARRRRRTYRGEGGVAEGGFREISDSPLDIAPPQVDCIFVLGEKHRTGIVLSFYLPQ